MPPLKDLTGQNFGRLTVLYRDTNKPTKRGAYWVCKCSCENKTIKSILSALLLKGDTKSCGCLVKEGNNKKYNEYDLSGEYGIGYTTKGKEFYFDLEDYDLIKNYCWTINSIGYVTTLYNNLERKRRILLHRLILNILNDKKRIIDHINHNLRDNRKLNLRITNTSQNLRNKSRQKNNTSGVTGVSWNKCEECWKVYISVDCNNIYLGRFMDFNEAVKARKEAEDKYHGEYSYDNSMKLNKEIINE